MGNLDQSDASTFQSQDSWLGRLHAQGGRLVFYGEDTWLRLFGSTATSPSFFSRSEGVNGFMTSVSRERGKIRRDGHLADPPTQDYIEVDSNVTRHVSEEMEQSDWDAMILHYLGVDHIGHMSGSRAPHMIEKQKQMDDVVKTVFEAIETRSHHQNTLLVLLGDHGMSWTRVLT
jgi:ethanolaminephosphotransferase